MIPKCQFLANLTQIINRLSWCCWEFPRVKWCGLLHTSCSLEKVQACVLFVAIFICQSSIRFNDVYNVASPGCLTLVGPGGRRQRRYSHQRRLLLFMVQFQAGRLGKCALRTVEQVHFPWGTSSAPTGESRPFIATVRSRSSRWSRSRSGRYQIFHRLSISAAGLCATQKRTLWMSSATACVSVSLWKVLSYLWQNQQELGWHILWQAKIFVA